MTLEELKARKLELEQAQANISNSFQMINGHIAECAYQISLLEADDSTKVEENIAECEVLPVE